MEAFREAEAKAGITLLEPIMKVVVISPEGVPGPDRRRHQQPPRHHRGNERGQGRGMVMAKIPLANLFGYTSDLRGATKGHGELQHGVQPLRRRSARNWPTCRRRTRRRSNRAGRPFAARTFFLRLRRVVFPTKTSVFGGPARPLWPRAVSESPQLPSPLRFSPQAQMARPAV